MSHDRSLATSPSRPGGPPLTQRRSVARPCDPEHPLRPPRADDQRSGPAGNGGTRFLRADGITVTPTGEVRADPITVGTNLFVVSLGVVLGL
jgi:hypothetical protein